MLQHIEKLQDQEKGLDRVIAETGRELEKLETFINSENGLNQKRVLDLEEELRIDDENILHLEQVLEEMKAKVEFEEANTIQKDIELNKKIDDLHELSIKIVEGNMDIKHLSKSLKNEPHLNQDLKVIQN